MKKIVLLSILLHVVLLVLLAPWLKTRMEFDRAEEARRSEEVRQRELERQDHERLKREKQQLTERQARDLKREAEQRKREELTEKLERLRELRDEIAEKHREELEQFRGRTREEVLAMEHIDFRRMAEQFESQVEQMTGMAGRKHLVIAAYATGDRGLDGDIDDFRIFHRLLSDAEMAAPPDDRLARHWRFESNLVDGVSGDEIGELARGANFGESSVDGEFALAGDGDHAHLKVGDHDFGDAFTLTFWARARPMDRPQLLAANCHWRDYNIGFRLEVESAEPTDEHTKLKLVTSGSGSKNKGKIVLSREEAFPLGQWVRVGLRLDQNAPKAEIFIDGKNVTAPDGETAEDTFTEGTHIDGSLLDRATALIETIEAATPTPESADTLKETIQELAADLGEKTDLNPQLHDVRNRITNATEIADDMVKELDGLAAKTNLETMNDTSLATAEFDADVLEQPAEAAEIYEAAMAMEQEIAEAQADIQAAKDAVMQNTSYAEAREQLSATTPARPDLADSLARDPLATVGELNEFRESLNQAGNEIQDMNARAENALGKTPDSGAVAAASQTRPGAAFATQAARISAARGSQSFGTVVNMIGFGSSSLEGMSEGMRGDYSGEGSDMKIGEESRGPRINQQDILGKALPGRRFTTDSLRRGWLYIDTWYVIGPWENDSEVNYANVHQPEREIDFDARYYDGKYADDPEHRDRVLKWEFYQSDQARCQPPRVYAASTYYAYTDIWFEEPRDMLIAVASDDASRVWLNGEIIWQDEGLSPWKLGEGYRRVHFRKGYNEMLVRIENGPIHCVWSVLLCPPEVVEP